MGTASDDPYRVRRWWVAFCSGWWLAGAAFGTAHAVALSRRPGTTASWGRPRGDGSVAPGARPLLYAGETLGVSGLPMGFAAILIGAVVGAIVWASLPVVLYVERRDAAVPDAAVPSPSVADVPDVAAGPGVGYLRRTGRWRGGSDRSGIGRAVATAVLAYFVGALGILSFGLLFP